MTKNKLAELKKSVKLSALAKMAGITAEHLSRILSRQTPTTEDRAKLLAEIANKMMMQKNYFRADDFFHRKETK